MKVISKQLLLAAWPKYLNSQERDAVEAMFPDHIPRECRWLCNQLAPPVIRTDVILDRFLVEIPDAPTPDIPAEVWMLRHKNSGEFVPAYDEIRGGECYLCTLTEREAKILADTQNDEYDIDCEPVRVK